MRCPISTAANAAVILCPFRAKSRGFARERQRGTMRSLPALPEARAMRLYCRNTVWRERARLWAARGYECGFENSSGSNRP